MKVALSWLKEYVKIPLTTAELTERLIMTAAEVEQVIIAPPPVKGAVVATIKQLELHPNADRLRLVTVAVRQQSHQVVCGAKNMAVGDKVPFIAVGQPFYDMNGELATLSAAKLRGVISKGMLASERELGLSAAATGIMILDHQAKEGQTIAEYLAWVDPVLDLEITPNRGDLQSYIGVAREVAMIAKTRLNLPSVNGFSIDPADTNPCLATEVTTDHCDRYVTITLDQVTNGPTPAWLKNRLLLSGIESINAVVDVTNYVMLETGQPLHAFDYAKLAATGSTWPKLTVRQAKAGESLVTLDGTTLTLNAEDMVIADVKPVALAGVVGGQATAIEMTTTKMVLEAAIFSPGSIRRSARRHGLRTESVTRFEKGIDEEQTIVAIKRAVALITDICGGKPVGRLADINLLKKEKTRLGVSLDRAARIIGQTFDKTKVKNQLSAIGFQVSTVGQNRLSVLVPSWRGDVTREEDIYEEMARLFGYDCLPATLPVGPFVPLERDQQYAIQLKLRSSLIRQGLRDLINQAFVSSAVAQKYQFPPPRLITIANPTSLNEQHLRPRLIYALMERAAVESRSHENLSSFEIGHIFWLKEKQPVEETHLALCVLTNQPVTAARQLKEALTRALAALELELRLSFATAPRPHLNCLTPQTENILLNGTIRGELGVVSTAITKQNRIRGDRQLVVAECDITGLDQLARRQLTYRAPSRFPQVIRDINHDLSQQKQVGEVLRQLKQAKIERVIDIDVRAIFDHGDRRTVTYRLTLGATDHTLNETEIAASLKQVTAKLAT